MEEKPKFKYLDWIILISSIVLNLLFFIIIYSVETNIVWNQSIWEAAFNYSQNNPIQYFCTGFVVAFIVVLVFYILSITFLLVKKKKLFFYIAIPYHLVLSLSILCVHIYFKFMTAGALVCNIFNIILLAATLIYLIFRSVGKQPIKVEHKENPEKMKIYKACLLIFESIAVVLMISIFFIPLFSYKNSNNGYLTKVNVILIKALASGSFELYIYIIFIVLFLVAFFCILYYITTLSYYFKTNEAFVKRSKASLYSSIGIILLFFLLGYFMTIYNNMENENSATTVSYIPFLVSMVILIIYSIFQGKLGLDLENKKKEEKNKPFKVEPLIFVFIFTLITFISLFFNVVEIHFKSSTLTKDVAYSGYQLLKSSSELGSGYQIVSFFLFTILFVSGGMLVLSIVSFFAKYKDYYKVIKISAYINVIFMFLLGLFGFYYKITQKMNEEYILAIIQKYNYTIVFPTDYSYKVTSQMFYIFILSFVVLVIMIFRGHLNLKVEEPTIELKACSEEEDLEEKKPLPEQLPEAPIKDTPVVVFDACPAFTELDSKIGYYNSLLEERKTALFENLTLPNLVKFIVEYARESRLHLSYSLEDIATFVAGLGASRLAILQGMSGTGKTSLPKIFAEAIMGNCEIVEVESSWRDKNELLGYYNEFSKCFTPKKFTQCLYKAKLNEEVVTFIVLDEMNLSRIEYYFSDFLSLMEHEEDKREIKLLNIKLSRKTEEGEFEYCALTDGHTIKIPKNVWFVGTANRDESTFEISDKVYDRAQTMNFNKRAPKIHTYNEPIPQKFLSYEQLAKLLEDAKNHYTFEAEENKIIQQVEKLLIPFNISFGNRILKQMEEFVKIYCACFDEEKTMLNVAVEKILLSKVVSKLEFKVVENKEALARSFDELGLKACSSFIRKLNED